MAKEILSERQKTVLLYSQFFYHEGPEKVAAISGVPVHQVRYDQKALIDRGLMVLHRKINQIRLGYYLFHIHLAVKSQDAAKLLKVLSANSRVVHLSRNGGERAIGVTILSRTPDLIFGPMDEAAAKSKVDFSQVGWAVESTFYHFGVKSLGEQTKALPVMVQDSGDSPLAIDNVDAKLLKLLTRGAPYNASSLARAIGTPVSTIQYRLKRLEEQRVILPISAFAHCGRLGYTDFEVLIQLAQAPASEHQRFISFCHRHRSITILIRSFGDWQYKFVATVERPAEVFDLEDELLEVFPDFVQKISIIAKRETCKAGDFPAEDFE